MGRSARAWIAAALACACTKQPEFNAGANLVDVTRSPPPADFRLRGPVSCEASGAAPDATTRCETRLRSLARDLDADLVVVEGETPCNGCVALRGTAYRRELPYERKTLRGIQPTFTNQSEHRASTGTGFAVSTDGDVLTANHVVKDARAIVVTLADGDVRVATVKHAEPDLDLCVLSVGRATPAYLPLGNASDVELGRSVFTLGFPVVGYLGLEPKFSEGVVSARSGGPGKNDVFLISVPVQPGNSGGPLVTDDGRVVGVVSARTADQWFFRLTGTIPQGLNFAVKTDPAKGWVTGTPPAPAPDRKDAIARTTAALCFVEGISGKDLLRAPPEFGKSEGALARPGFERDRAGCAGGDAEACLSAAREIARVCPSGTTPHCDSLAFARMIIGHACAVGRGDACSALHPK